MMKCGVRNRKISVKDIDVFVKGREVEWFGSLEIDRETIIFFLLEFLFYFCGILENVGYKYFVFVCFEYCKSF